MTKITLREAEKEDWPAIVALHLEQQRRQGTNYELPYLFGPEIALCVVGVDAAGAVRSCAYVERIAELRFVGSDPRVTAAARKEAPGLAYILKQKGYRWLECFVPRQLAGAIGRPLARAGFVCADGELSHYTLDLREDPREAEREGEDQRESFSRNEMRNSEGR